jgi:hypothetical protein
VLSVRPSPITESAIEYQSQFGQDPHVDEHVFRGLTGGVFVDIVEVTEREALDDEPRAGFDPRARPERTRLGRRVAEKGEVFACRPWGASRRGSNPVDPTI